MNELKSLIKQFEDYQKELEGIITNFVKIHLNKDRHGDDCYINKEDEPKDKE